MHIDVHLHYLDFVNLRFTIPAWIVDGEHCFSLTIWYSVDGK